MLGFGGGAIEVGRGLSGRGGALEVGGGCGKGGGANAEMGGATGRVCSFGSTGGWGHVAGGRGATIETPPPPFAPPVPPDLTAAERLELESIRRRKQELLGEIQRLREELSEAMGEVEGLEASEGRWDPPPYSPPPHSPPSP